MKKILLSIVALCCTVVAGAQTTDQISAILQVGNEAPQVFYGIDALKKAMAAAPNKEGVITLSSGNFNPTTVNKDVKIYGAGFETNEAEGITLTNINGGFDVNLPQGIEGPHNIHIEGVYVNGNIAVKSAINGFTFAKGRLGGISFNVATTSINIRQSYIVGNIIGAHNLYVKNSYIDNSQISSFSDESTVLIDHCILARGTDYDYSSNHFNCVNSIVRISYINSVQTYNYCLLPNRANLNGFIGSDNNYFSVSDANVFEDAENFNYSADRTFTLKDPDTYKGNDGEPVGPSGGIGWNKIPGTPIVKNLNATVSETNLNVTYDAVAR